MYTSIALKLLLYYSYNLWLCRSTILYDYLSMTQSTNRHIYKSIYSYDKYGSLPGKELYLTITIVHTGSTLRYYLCDFRNFSFKFVVKQGMRSGIDDKISEVAKSRYICCFGDIIFSWFPFPYTVRWAR